jgi:hypothetical protein
MLLAAIQYLLFRIRLRFSENLSRKILKLSRADDMTDVGSM